MNLHYSSSAAAYKRQLTCVFKLTLNEYLSSTKKYLYYIKRKIKSSTSRTANGSKRISEGVGEKGTVWDFIKTPALMLWVDLYDIAAPRRKYCNLTWIQNSDIGNMFYDSSARNTDGVFTSTFYIRHINWFLSSDR